jgi:hypothetical protein
MRPLLRHLFTLWAAAIVPVFISTCVLWVRSYWVGDQYYRSHWTALRGPDVPHGATGGDRLNERAIWLISGRGGFAVETRFQDISFPWHLENARPVNVTTRISGDPSYPAVGSAAPSGVGRLGFGYWSSSYGSEYVATSRRIWFPAWSAALLTGAFPAMWLQRHARERRGRRWARAALCSKCGYDLCASPGRCPECGAVQTD